MTVNLTQEKRATGGEELRSSELLLDLGAWVRTPAPVAGRKKKPGKVTLHRPYAGTLIAMARRYNRIGVTAAELKEYDADKWAKLIAEHGHDIPVSWPAPFAVALSPPPLRRGWWRGGFVVEWCTPVLGDVMLPFIESIDTRPFGLLSARWRR